MPAGGTLPLLFAFIRYCSQLTCPVALATMRAPAQWNRPYRHGSRSALATRNWASLGSMRRSLGAQARFRRPEAVKVGAGAPTLFGAIELLVNNQTAIFEDIRLPHLLPSSSRSDCHQDHPSDCLITILRGLLHVAAGLETTLKLKISGLGST